MINGGMMFSKRDIVVIDFPYSDLVNSKKRPVVILGEKNEDFIICAITSNPSVKGVKLSFEENSLPFESTIKYWQIQTIIKSRAERKIAKITKTCYEACISQINKLFTI